MRSEVSWIRSASLEAKSLVKLLALIMSRLPTNQLTISLLSASMAVHVQTSPAPSTGRFIVSTFDPFAAQKLQISSH